MNKETKTIDITLSQDEWRKVDSSAKKLGFQTESDLLSLYSIVLTTTFGGKTWNLV